MIQRFLAAASAIGAALAATAFETKAGEAHAAVGEPLTVIELFTSQGCSSCPPADALLERYAARPGVVALGFHVDYWDYLGWADNFASATFSARQRQYAAARGDGAVYTPQAVINGRRHVVGSSATEIEAALGERVSSVEVKAILDGTSLDVRVGSGNPASAQADILVAAVQPAGIVKIGRGENSGRTITYRNVVRSLIRIGAWDGRAVTLQRPLSAFGPVENGSYVVLVQQANAGPILGAAVATDTP